MANLTFVPSNKPSTAGIKLSLEDIPQDVKDDVEGTYKALKEADGSMYVEFPSLGELNAYIAQMKAYCALRPEGEIRFRKSPARDLKSTAMKFRITDVQTPEEKTTDEIRTAVDNVKTAAKK